MRTRQVVHNKMGTWKQGVRNINTPSTENHTARTQLLLSPFRSVPFFYDPPARLVDAKSESYYKSVDASKVLQGQ